MNTLFNRSFFSIIWDTSYICKTTQTNSRKTENYIYTKEIEVEGYKSQIKSNRQIRRKTNLRFDRS